MAYLGITGKSSHHTVPHRNRMSLIRIDRIQIRYLNVRPEPDDFIPYLTFKPYDYRHRNNHNSQPYGNTSHSNEGPQDVKPVFHHRSRDKYDGL